MVLVSPTRTLRTKWWCVVVVMMVAMVMQVTTLNGPNVCMVKQKYNITKRVKYRAPMSVRTYVWCLAIPPRCSMWTTEMRDLTRLETEERTAEVAVCCPGYKMKDVSCVPICPNGKTGPGCSEDCPPNRWGPNCVNECTRCQHGECLPTTGECHCQRGWQGESCELRMTTTTTATSVEEPLITHTSTKPSSPPTTPAITTVSTTAETKTTARSTLPVTSSALTSTSTVIPTIASTKVTFPIITSEKTTETITSSTETRRTSFQTTTEPYKPLMTTITKGIEEAVTVNPETNRFFNTTLTALPTITTNIEVKIIPTVAYKNSVKQPEVSGLSSTLRTTEKSQEVTTLATVPIMNDKTTTPVIVVPITEIKTKERNLVTTISSTLPTITSTVKINPTTDLIQVESDTVKPVISTTSKEITLIIPVTNKETKPETTKRPETTPETTKKPETTPDTTKKPETPFKVSTTAKFKPKEIWIKPAQKGESMDTKKILHDVSKPRVATNKEFTINTTPKTIIVSIIPTSVSYATFKKIALTTASFMPQKNSTSVKVYHKATEGFTKPMSTQTYATPPTVKIAAFSESTRKQNDLDGILLDLPSKSNFKDTSKIESNKTNSMTEKSSIHFKPISNSSTTISSINAVTTEKKILLTNPTAVSTTIPLKTVKPTHKLITERKNITKAASKPVKVAVEKKSNHTKTLTIHDVTTEDPGDEEMFHILTEPEHITAVMGEKETGRSSIDLVSVISIAGGVMMAVITVAVVIVMIERCRRPRYEDVRKINDIHMQVMIEGSDAPPPYVRSIFHTPLPEPPMSDKCHYQPISTLDRNLKQFMRPVVVQTISPIMLENFRGILECHYDHLPRRNHDFVPMEARCSVAPSMGECSELHHIQQTFRESTLESLKCEAKLDVIDTTTSEPLYAEIPCWRPPSEHAIEIMNLNGEAVTEL